MYVLYGSLRSALATVDWIFRWNNLTRCAAHNWQGGRIGGQRTIQREGLNPWTIVNNNNNNNNNIYINIEGVGFLEGNKPLKNVKTISWKNTELLVIYVIFYGQKLR